MLASLTSLLTLVPTAALRRRVIQRGARAWYGIAINEYVIYSDQETFKDKFRIMKQTFQIIKNLLSVRKRHGSGEAGW